LESTGVGGKVILDDIGEDGVGGEVISDKIGEPKLESTEEEEAERGRGDRPENIGSGSSISVGEGDSEEIDVRGERNTGENSTKSGISESSAQL
jgi:hypothetical protein